MTNFESLVLGVVQGVTEFLPISSTAHLRIVPALLHWGDPGAAYTAVLQLGSLVAVIGYFLPELMKMLSAGGKWARRSLAGADAPGARARVPRRGDDAGRRRRGAVPARHRRSFRSLWVIAGAMIAVALLLAVVEKSASHDRAVRRAHAAGRAASSAAPRRSR